MKKQLLFSMVISLVCSHLYAQQLEISGNATLELSNGVSFYANGLTLKPSATVNLSDLSIQPKATLTNQTLGTAHISRTYSLGTNAPNFSGEILINYLDQELNGLDESQLKFAVYNNTQWQYIATSTTNTADNIATAAQLDNIILGELALGLANVLPLRWGELTAKRQGLNVKIVWQTYDEQDIAHFIVERSRDGQNWEVAIQQIVARNLAGPNLYDQIDRPNDMQRRYYRVKQVDMDGKESYSAIAVLQGTSAQESLSIYPNPAKRIFSINGLDERNVKNVMLYDLNGRLLKQWENTVSNYDISAISEGLHLVKITSADGTTVTQKLLIKK